MGQITLPTWLFIVLLFLAVLAILDRLFVPSLRWFFRRRLNRVLTEIGSRLEISIRPFQLTKRQVLIDRLIYDSKVMEAIEHFSARDKVPREVLQAEALSYAREIVPSFNAYFYFRLGYWVAQKAARLLYRVRLGSPENERLLKINPNATVVFVMNHRSNMDYVLVAFLAAERTTLSYAVGEWARIWPLETLFKFMGAFFVRRNSQNQLYRLVLERYIHMATREGVCQAVFLEGGLTRDGRLRPPKMGLIDYMLRHFDPETDRDIFFIPVGLNYDRTIEDRSQIRALDPQATRRSWFFVLKTTFGFIVRQILLMARGRWRVYGYACVNFGAPISAAEYCRGQGFVPARMDKYMRHQRVEDFCRLLMAAMEKNIPVLPLPLVAAVLLEAGGEPLSVFEIKARVHYLIENIRTRGAPIFFPREEYDEVLTEVLDTLKLRRLALEREGLFQADPAQHDLLKYYANSIEHWWKET
ncbi:MAG: 1-acyl-sn-glycerol-3-phosphate acyltransferase [Thermodesulfobacteriota bacterium]